VEIYSEVKKIRVDQLCKKCSKGYMIIKCFDKGCVHRCDRCSHEAKLDSIYPKYEIDYGEPSNDFAPPIRDSLEEIRERFKIGW